MSRQIGFHEIIAAADVDQRALVFAGDLVVDRDFRLQCNGHRLHKFSVVLCTRVISLSSLGKCPTEVVTYSTVAVAVTRRGSRSSSRRSESFLL